MGTAQVLDSAECDAIAAAVQATLQQQGRKLRLSWRKMALDILSVLCGLRPAAMLDYAVVSRGAMLQLAAAVRAAAGQALVTAEHEGVMYFLHAPWLLRRLEAHSAAQPAGYSAAAAAASADSAARPPQDGSATTTACASCSAASDSASVATNSHGGSAVQQAAQHPQYIVFDAAAAGGEDTVVRWAIAAERQEGNVRIQLLRRPLQQALAAAAQPQDDAVSSAAAADATPESGTHLLLDAMPGLPLLPTLNGWLLGYPAVYLLRSAHEVDVAARQLSAAPLLHCSAYAECRVASRGLQGEGDKGWLYAFTLPASLATSAELQSWRWMPPGGDADVERNEQLSGKAIRAQAWSEVRRTVEVSSPRPIVL